MAEITQKQKDLAIRAINHPNRRIWNLFPFMLEKEWIQQAMYNVLQNKGANTPGIDGFTKTDYYNVKERTFTPKAMDMIESIIHTLKENEYKPKPVRRIYIPKANGKRRPIGIPTIEDRIIQEALRMILEPIYEGDFLNCSYGFRPNRCTMDAITQCARLIEPNKGYYWIIEGDIKGCFDNVDHKTIMKLLKRRIADRKLTDLIYKFLKAGYQEKGQVYKPDKGTPQGGVISPLLANIYLHELDRWWEKKYHLTPRKRYSRRRKGLANFNLIRYADDFVILSNGTKHATIAMKQEVAELLRTELKLELSEEKTTITHAWDGFDFLGFNLRLYKGKGTGGVIIRPTKKNVLKVMKKIETLLYRATHEMDTVNRIRTINPVIRGWANYYRHVSASKTFAKLDWYSAQKFFKWYRGKYQLPVRKGTLKAIEWLDKEKPIHLQRFTETKIEIYGWRRIPQPYIEIDAKEIHDTPFSISNWFGNSPRNADLRMKCIKRDKGVCQICRRPKINLEAHHIISVAKGGEDTLDNLVTVCQDCHRGKGWQERIETSGEPYAMKVASTVRGREEGKHAKV